MADEVNLVKPAEQQIAMVQDLPDWLGLHRHQSLSTFDTSTDEGLRTLTKMSGQLDSDLLSVMNTEIDLVGFYMSPYERIDKNGEVKPLVFIGLLDKDGKTYSTSSIGVRKTLLMIARQFGFKPWNPPVRVRVIPVPLETGTMYSLEFVSRGEPSNPPKSKGK